MYSIIAGALAAFASLCEATGTQSSLNRRQSFDPADGLPVIELFFDANCTVFTANFTVTQSVIECIPLLDDNFNQIDFNSILFTNPSNLNCNFTFFSSQDCSAVGDVVNTGGVTDPSTPNANIVTDCGDRGSDIVNSVEAQCT